MQLSSNIFLHILDELEDGVLVINSQEKIIEANRKACSLYDYSRYQFCQMHLADLLAPNVSLISDSVFCNPEKTEVWHCGSDGRPFFVELHIRPLLIPNGHESLTVVQIRNITKTHQIKLQRAIENQIYKAVVETGSLLIARTLPDTTLTFANDMFCQYFGHERKDILGRKLCDIPQDEVTREAIRTNFSNYVQQPRTFIHDNLVLNGKGGRRWVQFTESPIFDFQGHLQELQIVAIDIHERKTAELKLSQDEAKYRALMDQSNEGIAIVEMGTGRILEVNQKLCDIFGYTFEELLSLPNALLTSETDADFQKYAQVLNKKSALPISTIQVIAKNGERIEVERLVKTINITGNAMALVSFRDVSAREKYKSTLHKQTEELKKRVVQLQKAWAQTIDVLSSTSEAKDPYTAGHQNRVAQLAEAMGLELNLSQDQLTGLRMASRIHDIGKISLPTEILSKPGKLSRLEYSMVQLHVTAGYDLLRDLDLPWNVAEVVLQHHERFDGSGYPGKIKGTDILFKARILGVADVVEAMSSHRPYRPALGIEAALAEIEKGKGRLYDPDVVDACLKVFIEKSFAFA